MHLKRTFALTAASALALSLAACGSGSSSSSSSSSAASFGDCKVTSKKGSMSLKPAKAGTLTVETTLPAQGWWNGTTPESIKSGYEYCLAANLANMAGLKSVTVKNVSFAQLVAGATSPTHSAAFSAGGNSQGDTLSQTLSTTSGVVYALDFDAAVFHAQRSGSDD